MATQTAQFRVFLGSSSKAMNLTKRIASWIAAAGAQPVAWNTAFKPGQIILPELIKFAHETDAAIFIFAEDDRVRIGKTWQMQTRDNVLIEYGMFSSVKGTEKAIVCREGGPKMPTDLGGVVYVTISASNPRLGKVDVIEWVKDLIARSGSPPMVLSTPATDLSEAYESLRSRIAGRRQRPGETTEDVVTDALTRGIMDGLLNPRAFPCVVEHETSLTVSRTGDCRCKVRQKLRGDRRRLLFSPFFMTGDVELSDFREIALQVRCPTPQHYIWWKPVDNLPQKKSVLVMYDPPLQDGEQLEIELEWEWPKIFAKLVDREADIWDEQAESAIPVETFNVNFCMHPRLPRIRIATVGQTGGKEPQVMELPVD